VCISLAKYFFPEIKFGFVSQCGGHPSLYEWGFAHTWKFLVPHQIGRSIRWVGLFKPRLRRRPGCVGAVAINICGGRGLGGLLRDNIIALVE